MFARFLDDRLIAFSTFLGLRKHPLYEAVRLLYKEGKKKKNI